MARICQGCEREIVPAARQGNPRLWCSDACRNRSTYLARKAAGKVYFPRSSVYPRGCNECAASYVARSARGRFCSTACQAADKNRRQNAQYAENPQRFVEMSRRNRRTMTEAQRAAVKLRVRQYRQRVGYLECARAADQRRRARKASAAVEKFRPVEIFERDGWRCGICTRKVNRLLAWPDPRSPSLDHIVPLSLHGDHTRANVRLAHLDCNVKRGNRIESEQLALIG